MPRLPSLSEPLDGGRVRLRDAAQRDIPEVLIAYEDDPQLHLRLLADRPPSGAQLGRLAESEIADRAAGSRATLTIVAPPADLCLGQVSVHNLDWDHGRADVSIWLAPQARGRGLGSGALTLAAQWLLGTCGLRRVQGFAESGNDAVLAAARRAGFQHEGVLHAYVRRRSGRIDVAVLSRVSGDRNRR